MAANSDDRIDSYINRDGIKNDTAFMIESLNNVLNKISEINKVKLQLFGTNSLSDALKQINAITSATDQLNKQKIAALNIAIKEIDLKKKQIKLENDLIKQATASSSSSSGGDSQKSLSEFQLLKKSAKEAKDEYNSLLLQYGKLDSRVEASKSTWKSLEVQLRAVAKETKNAFQPELIAANNSRISQLTKNIAVYETIIDRIKNKLKTLATSGDRNTPEFKREAKDLEIYSGKLKIAQQELGKLSIAQRESNAGKAEAAKSLKSIDQEVKGLNVVQGYYAALNDEIKRLIAESQELQAKGLTKALTDDETKRIADITVKVNDLSAAIAKIDNTAGKGQKNVYAWSQQMFSMQQIVRELPNIAFGANVFLASLSNNIPIFTDDLQRLAKRNKELAAAGQETVPVFKQVLKNFLSLTTLIGLLTALLTIAGPRVWEWSKSLFRSAEANKAAYLASKEYQKTLKLLNDTINDLLSSQSKLNDLSGRLNKDVINSLKTELAYYESIGVSADKLFGRRQQIADLESSVALNRLTTTTGNIRTNQPISNREELASLEAEKKRIIKETFDAKDLLAATNKKTGKLIISPDSQLAADLNKSIEAISKRGIKLETEIDDYKLKIANQVSDKKLSDEEFLTKRRIELEAEYRKYETQQVELSTKIRLRNEEIINNRKSPIGDAELAVLKSQQEDLKSKSGQAFSQVNEIITSQQAIADAAAEQQRLAGEKDKFYSEQKRRIRLSNELKTQEGIIAINNRIVSNERSSEKQKLAALKQIENAQLAIAAAELKSVKATIGISKADLIEAENTYSQRVREIKIDSEEQNLSIIDGFLERKLTALDSSLKSESELTLKVNEDISQGIEYELENRLAYERIFFNKKKELQKSEFEKELQIAGLSAKEAATFIDTGEVEINGKKKTFEELQEMRKRYNAAIQILALDSAQNVADIYFRETEKIQEQVDRLITESDLTASVDSTEAKKSAREQIQALRNLNLKKKLSHAQLSKDILKITQQRTDDELEIERLKIEDGLNVYKNAAIEKQEAEDRLARAKIGLDLAKNGTEEQKADAKIKFDLENKIYQNAVENFKKLTDLEAQQEANRQAKVDAFEAKEKERLERKLRTIQELEKISNELIQLGQSILEANFARKMQMLDEELSALDKKAAKEKEIIDNSLLSEEEKAKAVAELNNKTENQRLVIEAKKRKTERDRAQAEKIANMARIAIETAFAIFKLTAQAAAAFPLGGIYAAQIPGVIASAGIALATIASQPLPKLKHGTKDFEGGYAILGDGGRSELVMNPDGGMFITGDTPELHHLPKHAAVLPDAKKALEASMSMAKRTTDGVIGMSIAPNIQVPGFENLSNTMKNGFTILTKTIQNKPEIVLRRGMNKDLLLRYGADYWKYIN